MVPARWLGSRVIGGRVSEEVVTHVANLRIKQNPLCRRALHQVRRDYRYFGSKRKNQEPIFSKVTNLCSLSAMAATVLVPGEGGKF